MGLFDRWRGPEFPDPEPDFAVPLTPAEAAMLIELLRECDKATHRRPALQARGFDREPVIVTSGYLAGRGATRTIDVANEIAEASGIAAALGHEYVPHTVSGLKMHEYALNDLRAADSRRAAEFERFLVKMNVLAGVARVHGWTVQYDKAIGGMRWTNPPTQVGVATAWASTGQPQIAS